MINRHALLHRPLLHRPLLRHPLPHRCTGVAVATVLLLGLTGCTGAPAPAVTATVTITPTPSATPTPTPTPAPTEEATLIPNPVVPTTTPNAVPEPLPEGPAVDLGAIPGARGAATADGAGALLTYTVVEGDSFFDIAQRFNIPQQRMLRMNPSVPGLGENIYINQTINLDWTTTL